MGSVSPFRQNGFRVNGITSFLTAVDPATVEARRHARGLAKGRSTASREAAESVLVHRDVAAENGWSLGRRGAGRVRVAGRRAARDRRHLRREPLGGRLRDLARHVRRPLQRAARLVRAGEGRQRACRSPRSEARSRRPSTEFPNVQVQDQAAFREQQAGFIDQLLGARHGAAADGDRDRAVRHREHARSLDLRADPRARAAARGRA